MFKSNLPEENIWANMDFIYNPAKTKRMLRDEKKMETMRKMQEDNRKRNEEFEKAIKNLEELKKQYTVATQPVVVDKKKTPKGKK